MLAGDQCAATDTAETIDASGESRPIEDPHPGGWVADPGKGGLCEPTEETAIRSWDHQLGEGRFDAAHPVGADLLAEDEECHNSDEYEVVHLRGKAYHPAGSVTRLEEGTSCPLESNA